MAAAAAAAGEQTMPNGPLEDQGAAPAAPPLAQAALVVEPSRAVDLKSLTRPPTFSGLDVDFQDWAFRMRAFAVLMDLDAPMAEALRHDGELPFDALSPQSTKASKFLWSVFAQLLHGRALAILRLAPEGHGLEVWRKLHAEYCPATSQRLVAVLSGLLAPAWSVDAPFYEQLLEWERQVAVYEQASHHPLSDDRRQSGGGGRPTT